MKIISCVEGWIKSKLFVMRITSIIIKFIKNDQTILERFPLEYVAKKKQLAAYKHSSIWQCIDTKRDISYIQAVLPKLLKWKKKFLLQII